MQNPEKARLLLIRGDDMDGLSYHLKAEQHFVGRQGQIEFPKTLLCRRGTLTSFIAMVSSSCATKVHSTAYTSVFAVRLKSYQGTHF